MKTLIYAWRFLVRLKSYTLINLMGLSLSLACCIILLRYINNELSVDENSVDKNTVYGVSVMVDGVNPALSIVDVGSSDSTNIDNSGILARAQLTILEKDYVQYEGERYIVNGIVADNEYFKMFKYEPLQGSISLDAPDVVLLTEDFAAKIFGKENPIGKKLRYANGSDITVTGIIKKPSCKRTLDFNMVLSSGLSDSWERMPMEFIRIESASVVERLNETGKTPRFLNPHISKLDTRKYTFSLIPLKDIYWSQSLLYNTAPDMGNSGNKLQLYVFAGMCLMIFLAGIINFINLYMMVMTKRSCFYTLRKVFGAGKKVLFMHIYAENALLIIFSLFVAWFVVEIVNRPVNNLLGANLSYGWFDLYISLGFLVLLPLAVTTYSYYRCQKQIPVLTLRTVGNTYTGSINSRMVFLFIQYLLTFILLILAFYFNSQLRFMLNTDIGFETKDIIHAELVYESKDYNFYTPEKIQQRMQHVQEIDNALDECPYIRSWTASPYYILGFTYYTGFTNNKDQTISAVPYIVTPQFFDIYNLEFTQGRFPENISENVCVVNESAMKALGYTSIEGATVLSDFAKKFNSKTVPMQIVGVVKDFYIGHISSGTSPIVFTLSNKKAGDKYEIACCEGKVKEVVKYLRQVQKKVYGVESFKYSMLADKVRELYKNDERLANVYLLFSCGAMFVVCLGLFGISLYDIRCRYREIAIRKVNGASIKDLYCLLGRKYMVTLLLSFVMACPISWYIIYSYSDKFVVKASVDVFIFIFAFLLVLFISVATIAYQLNKAIRINPADVIRSE